MEKISVSNISNINPNDLKGKIIAFHTDTVYGVGTLYQDEEGIEKIYQMKLRDKGKKIPLLCGSIDDVLKVALLNEKAKEISKYWPGALTMILKTKTDDDTIAVRIPDSQIALAVLNHFGPLQTTSVNISGEKELNSVNEIIEKFSSYIDYIVTDELPLSEKPSTIVDITTSEAKIIRKGSIEIK